MTNPAPQPYTVAHALLVALVELKDTLSSSAHTSVMEALDELVDSHDEDPAQLPQATVVDVGASLDAVAAVLDDLVEQAATLTEAVRYRLAAGHVRSALAKMP